MSDKLFNIKKLTCEIFAICIEVNEKTEYYCWCEFAGHVGSLDVSCSLKNDKTYQLIIREITYVKIDEYNEYEEIMSKLNEIKKTLMNLFKPNIAPIIEDSLLILKD